MSVLKKIIQIFSLISINTMAIANPQVGDRAPDFNLLDQNSKNHSLSDYEGKWLVVFFYPKAGTPGCTTEVCEFRDNIFSFDDIGVNLVGVSVDSVKSQKEFSDKYHLPFPLLSDSKKEMAGIYGVLGKVFGVASRQSFIINPDGVIAKHYQKVSPSTHTEEVLEDLKSMM
ncbi:MAG: peroxiredoxin [Pseudomonadota bacterium]|nr:peroxiredoxin [Pseudomonadota bacterium]|tara:strand:+ start:1849 stop:2361 length:513 start_codon:yes stop_codon:yes gene_type:complete